ncbi:MAG: PH domain-containing protein [Pirellulales bacterium]|nr:PH domain-containing protein [Pirellulales bacterium]
MKCTACRADVPATAAFCPACGAKIAADATAKPEPAQAAVETSLRSRLTPRGLPDSPEQDLWHGGYSPKAMLGAWVVSALISIACLIAPFLIASGSGWYLASFGIIAVAWIVPALVLLFRRMSISYRVTNQRLFHESGILRRRTDRIELIDVDDVATDQGPFERMMGVGSIRITSSDRTHPVLVLQGIEGVRDVAAKIDNGRRAERLRRGLHIETV